MFDPNFKKSRIVVFASGTGSNFEAIARACQSGELHAEIAMLICNVEGAAVLEKAKRLGVPTTVIPHAGLKREAHEERIFQVLDRCESLGLVDWIVLAGYMRILSEKFVQRFWDQSLGAARIVNIHPSLLPAFPGVHSYERALKAGVETTGCTVHLVGLSVDSGPIVAQSSLQIHPKESLESLKNRGLQLEHQAFVRALKSLFEGGSKEEVVRAEKSPRNLDLDSTGRRVLADISVFFPHWKKFSNLKAFGTQVYWVRTSDRAAVEKALDQEILKDVVSVVSTRASRFPETAPAGFQWWCLEKRLRPGVADNAGQVMAEAIQICGAVATDSSAGLRLWLCLPQEIIRAEVENYANLVFHNNLIERVSVLNFEEAWAKEGELFSEKPPTAVKANFCSAPSRVESIDLRGLGVKELSALSDKKLWALSPEELLAVQAHYAALNRPATDVELEVIAQTWSEHCKHKIFAAEIEIANERSDIELPTKVKSVFKTFIRGSTEKIPAKHLRSVFEDNAGVFSINDQLDCAIKVETHNSPSALDPYGGALTGIVGVNRDILGVGLGAEPIANVDVFCVGPLDHSEPLPPRLHHPRRILEGVRAGVEAGGNKSGIPTVTGAIVHHEGFLGKPLVFCGTIGLLPHTDKDFTLKKVLPGDRLVMVGGRIGKDGIHGATFSSLELNEDSPVSAVQLGDPLTQKRVWDFQIEARNAGLYNAVTDNGAGGLSSSVGEMATLCGEKGGAVMDVRLARVKYPGLLPYELVISESQERMTFAVPQENLSTFLELAASRNVECSVLGRFEDTGRFTIMFGDQKVGDLDLEFLHEGAPTMKLKARVPVPKKMPTVRRQKEELEKDLLVMLASSNVHSRRDTVEQYDHEVQARTVRKPYGSRNRLAPNDGATLRVSRTTHEGIAVGLGLAPEMALYDPWLSAATAFDEALRNAIVAGLDPKRAALVDNFCWPDPLESPQNPDAREKLGALVLACKALHDGAVCFGIPFISGKDSMKNDYRMGNVKISVPPTVLVTAVGRVPDVRVVPRGAVQKCDLQSPIYWCSAGIPKLDFQKSKAFFETIHDLISNGSIAVLHDVSDGGWLSTTSEILLGSGMGAKLVFDTDVVQDLFAEPASSFVLVPNREFEKKVERALAPFWLSKVGHVQAVPELEVHWAGLNTRWSVSALEKAYGGET